MTQKIGVPEVEQSLQDRDLLEIDRDIAVISKEIKEIGDEYIRIMRVLGDANYQRIVSEAKQLVHVYDMETWGRNKTTDKVRAAKALLDEEVARTLQVYQDLVQTSEGLKGQLKAYQSTLSGLQTRANLFKTEASLTSYQ